MPLKSVKPQFKPAENHPNMSHCDVVVGAAFGAVFGFDGRFFCFPRPWKPLFVKRSFKGVTSILRSQKGRFCMENRFLDPSDIELSLTIWTRNGFPGYIPPRARF